MLTFVAQPLITARPRRAPRYEPPRPGRSSRICQWLQTPLRIGLGKVTLQNEEDGVFALFEDTANRCFELLAME